MSKMKIAIILNATIALLVLAFSGKVEAQNPQPCASVQNSATVGQVLSAKTAGRTPVCSWTTGGGGGGSGTVKQINTTSPITGGPITTTGTIACATCVVGPASVTTGHLATFNGTTGKLIQDGGAVPTGPGTAFSTGIGNWWPFGNDFTAVGSNTIGAANVVLCFEFTAPMSMNLGIVNLEQIADDSGKHWAGAMYSADGNTLIATGSTLNSTGSTPLAETLVASLVGATTYNFCLSSDSAAVLTYGFVDSSGSNVLFLNIDAAHPRVFTTANSAAWSGTTPNFPATLGARTATSKGQPWTMFYK